MSNRLSTCWRTSRCCSRAHALVKGCRTHCHVLADQSCLLAHALCYHSQTLLYSSLSLYLRGRRKHAPYLCMELSCVISLKAVDPICPIILVMAPARVETLSGSGLESIPLDYVRPVEERPTESVLDLKNLKDQGPQLPVIDFAGWHSGDDEEKKRIMREVAKASQEWGAMQVLNHGISETLIARLQAAGKAFFDLPIEEKEKYANDSDNGKISGYGSKLANNASGQLEWEDYYFHILWPEQRRDVQKTWPGYPADYEEVTVAYGGEIRKLTTQILGALSLELGLEEGRMERVLGGEELLMELKINYYPRCPQPELALGVEAHTDISALTFLLHNMVPGLQLFHHGKWITAKCIPGALILQLGDQVEILSNGKYRSGLHRGLVNKEKVRISWAVFCCPPKDAVIGPMKEMVDDQNPALFPARTFQEHIDYKLFRKNQAAKETADARGVN